MTTREVRRRTEEHQRKLITRGPTEHQRITSHLLVEEVEQIGAVIPELVDLERAVMEDDGVFSSLPPPIVCVKFFSLGGKKLARVQVETR